MTAEDILYFQTRAGQEREAAQRARHPAAAAAHEAMAHEYLGRIGPRGRDRSFLNSTPHADPETGR